MRCRARVPQDKFVRDVEDKMGLQSESVLDPSDSAVGLNAPQCL